MVLVRPQFKYPLARRVLIQSSILLRGGVYYVFTQEALPKTDDFKMKLCRNAVIGFSASAISDTVSNSVRVIKVRSSPLRCVWVWVWACLGLGPGLAHHYSSLGPPSSPFPPHPSRPITPTTTGVQAGQQGARLLPGRRQAHHQGRRLGRALRPRPLHQDHGQRPPGVYTCVGMGGWARVSDQEDRTLLVHFVAPVPNHSQPPNKLNLRFLNYRPHYNRACSSRSFGSSSTRSSSRRPRSCPHPRRRKETPSS